MLPLHLELMGSSSSDPEVTLMCNTHVETPFSNTCLITENMCFFSQQDNAAYHIKNHFQHLLSIVNKNLVLITEHETETDGPRLT